MLTKRIVIKCGGNSLDHLSALTKPFRQLQAAGYQLILVHGGGAAINQLSQQLQIPQQFSDGLRITSPDILTLTQMVLLGKINAHLVRYLNQLKIPAVGLSGCDANLLLADYIDQIQFGEVGEIYQVNLPILNTLLTHQYLPVIAPMAAHRHNGILNINADSTAAAIAIAWCASHLILLSDIEGYYANYPDPTTLITELNSSTVEDLLNTPNQVMAGMYPKLTAAYRAITHHVPHVHIISAAHLAHLWEVITQQLTVGTRLVKGA